MRTAVLFVALTLFTLSSAFALDTNCNFCSKDTADFFNDNLTEQLITSAFISNDTNILLASDTSITDTNPHTVSGENNFKQFEAGSYNLDNIIELINKTEDIKSFTQDKIDLLANFRDGDDVVVPLGFFLYMNKKF
ncbi:MAG: hypothetical protein GWN50_05675 [Candidatus Dadabacteria bacterium]|nr:hypothetical protein [Candidatus Dadabacteria bacterium]